MGVNFITFFGQTNSNFHKEILTSAEINILNSIFFKERNDFDFNGKLVAFTVGTTGTQIENKKLFFKKYLDPVIEKKSKNVCSLIILTKAEKTKSGGFDAVIMSPSKIFTKQHRERLINILNELTLSSKEKSI
jgi:hypothetical protein